MMPPVLSNAAGVGISAIGPSLPSWGLPSISTCYYARHHTSFLSKVYMAYARAPYVFSPPAVGLGSIYQCRAGVPVLFVCIFVSCVFLPFLVASL